jgi:hypothetical protein
LAATNAVIAASALAVPNGEANSISEISKIRGIVTRNGTHVTSYRSRSEAVAEHCHGAQTA